MNLLNTTVAGLLLATSSLLNIANAGPITLDLAEQEASSGLIEYSLDLTGSNNYSVASDATFTLNLSGNDGWFNNLVWENNNIQVYLEALDLGIVLNSDIDDDLFDFSNSFFTWELLDTGSSYKTLTGTTTISQADWTNIVADDTVNISLSGSRDWLDFTSSGSVSYDVPEPATLAIFGLALLGFAARRVKK